MLLFTKNMDTEYGLHKNTNYEEENYKKSNTTRVTNRLKLQVLLT